MQQNSYHSVNRKVKATEYFENKKDWFCKSKQKIVTEIFRNKKKKNTKKGNAEEIDTTYMSEEDKQKLKE